MFENLSRSNKNILLFKPEYPVITILKKIKIKNSIIIKMKVYKIHNSEFTIFNLKSKSLK